MRSDELQTAKTESLFRDVNERIAESAEQIGADTAELVCECADPECGHRIEAPLEEYEETRADGAQFLVAAGHEVAEHEVVVRSRPGYRIVEKLKAVGAAARRLSPRRER
jgi:pyridoxine 5'-phosphate synthase PdxJ